MKDATGAFDPDATLATTLVLARQILSPVSGQEAALDARLLLEAAACLDRVGLLRETNRPLGREAADTLGQLIARRQNGEPVWRILGEREFWGLTFKITPAVLDPRPDTETLVEAGLAALAGRRSEPLRICDLGVGSGAVLCALLHELPNAVGVGVDRSDAACRVARQNADRLGLGRRALIVNGNWSDGLGAEQFDLVVSNPPYIDSADMAGLPREVRDHDPRMALDGGADGLTCYRAIAPDLSRLLRPGGTAAFEVGFTQAASVRAILATAGLVDLATRHDLGRQERVVTGRRAS